MVKRGLALSAAGAKVPFHVGACKRLLGEKAVKYDAVSGSSAGAWVAAFLCQFDIGHERIAYERLELLTNTLTNRKIYKHWLPFGPMHAFWKSGIYNSKPMRSLLKKYISPQAIAECNRELSVTAVDYVSGEPIVMHNNSPDILGAVAGSSAIPGVFPLVDWEGRKLMDGGIRKMTPIKALIQKGCEEIDIVIAYARDADTEHLDRTPEAADAAGRGLDLLINTMIWRDVQMVKMYNELIWKGGAPNKVPITLRVIAPHEPREVGLKFGGKAADELMLDGYHAAVGVT